MIVLQLPKSQETSCLPQQGNIVNLQAVLTPIGKKDDDSDMYNGKLLPEFIEEPSADPVRISRTQKQTLPTDVPSHRVPPQSASEVRLANSQPASAIKYVPA
eukprot:4785924-Amphidinium_carterae.1